MLAAKPPSLPGGQIIRTYPHENAPSDTESEGETHLEVNSEDEEQSSISTRLEQNQMYLDQQIHPPSGEESTWTCETRPFETMEGSQVVLIRKPTASNMSHRLLNPFIYRNIKTVGTLNDLATLLNTPADWEARYNQVVADGRITRKLLRFMNLPDDSPESCIQLEFSFIVSVIADRVGIELQPRFKTNIMTGGILARYEYDFRSKTDPHFLDDNGLNLLASEVKTFRTFGIGEMWYHGCRGIQVLSALYSFNCPTFLFTQRQWKLFVENSDRNAILRFPYNDNPAHTSHVNSSLVQPMGTTFLKAIVICLLSQRVSGEQPRQSGSSAESSQVITHKKNIVKRKRFDAPYKPKRKSARLSEKPRPKYVSGYDEKGLPIYSFVRVVPPDVVAKIENDIAMQEQIEYH